MDTQVHIIGIGGLPRSGKDTLAELFMEAGYFGVSLGDIVREFARERHKDAVDPISIANMTETSNWLRETRGSDVVLQEALHQFQQLENKDTYKGLLLWSVRAPVEVDCIVKHAGELIWVEASDEIRHSRALQYLRPGETETTLEEFKRQEALQWQPQAGIPLEVQMNVSYVKEHATHTLVNNDNDIAAFRKRAAELLKTVARS